MSTHPPSLEVCAAVAAAVATGAAELRLRVERRRMRREAAQDRSERLEN